MIENTFTDLIDLYNDMDEQWNQAAQSYSFECNGCKDNCCTSLFYHHTHVEHAFLKHGFEQLPEKERTAILELAHQYCDQTFANGNTLQSLKLLCPVNENGQCLLYAYRPMICRLHGIPHELNRPGYETVRGPGCDAGQFDSKEYIKFDRTVFYQTMAQIEITFRQKHNKTGKLKSTIAQILLSDE